MTRRETLAAIRKILTAIYEIEAVMRALLAAHADQASGPERPVERERLTARPRCILDDPGCACFGTFDYAARLWRHHPSCPAMPDDVTLSNFLPGSTATDKCDARCRNIQSEEQRAAESGPAAESESAPEPKQEDSGKMSDSHMHFDEKTERSFFRYPGSKTKPACDVEMTNAVRAWNLLVRQGREPAKENLEGFEYLMLCLIVVCHEVMGRPAKKKELREAFPGIGGDLLNLVLGGLRNKDRVSVCEEGCCYLPARELKIGE